MKGISVGLIGFGAIGGGVVKILQKNKDILDARVGFPIRLTRIADLDIHSDRGVPVDPGLLTTDVRKILDDPDISIVIELIGGTDHAREYILEAFQKGKHVVTANKALLAERGPDIFQAAAQAGKDIAFEAAVAGAIPILRSLREGLISNRFEKVLAILNGTCNYILTAMDQNPGVSFNEVLKEAQDLGYAEAEPYLDVDGLDAAHKLVILLTLIHGIRVPPSSIYVEGIRGIDPFDVEMAREFSYKIKLLAVCISHDGGVEVRLHPTMIPRSHPLAQVDGVFNGIYLKGDMVGDQLFYGRGAGREPTASAVVADVIEIARNIVLGNVGRVPPLGYPEDRISSSGVLDMRDVVTSYYIRIQALDRPGVLSKVAGIMADHNISIHSVVQKGRESSEAVPVVFLTHRAREADIQHAAKKIGELDVVKEAPVIVRIEDESLA